MKKKILSIVGARPQFIKHAPVQKALQLDFEALTLHTGQHYDYKMSDVFFKELGINNPEYVFSLDASASSHHGAQTAQIMVYIEKICLEIEPDAILIYGDTNSTLAGALVGAKLNIPLIHIEAGLRSFNRNMPEEVNRIIADEFASLLFCPTQTAVNNLKLEGIHHERIFECGDVMIDALNLVLPFVKKMSEKDYYFATIHRPYNTDFEIRMIEILTELDRLDKNVIFCIHPRTKNKLKAYGVELERFENIEFIDPVGYLESISYQFYCDTVITDSGGIQKEAYALKKKCITLRSETEWIETLKNGWNKLVFSDLSILQNEISKKPGKYERGIYGDGFAAKEIVEKIKLFI